MVIPYFMQVYTECAHSVPTSGEDTSPVPRRGSRPAHKKYPYLLLAAVVSPDMHADSIQLLFSTRQLPSAACITPQQYHTEQQQHRPCAARSPPSLPLTLPSSGLLLSPVLLIHIAQKDPYDGSEQRSKWHGWGDVSLLKQDGYEGEQQHAM